MVIPVVELCVSVVVGEDYSEYPDECDNAHAHACARAHSDAHAYT